jgi:hypothetical protein
MVIDYLSNEFWALTHPTGNYATNGYPSRIPTVTAPSGDGVIPFGHMGGYSPGHLLLIPFGAGVATNTMGMKVLGWRSTGLNVGNKLWVPLELGTYAITLGTGTGVALADLTATALFATTITMTGGPTFVTSGAAPVSPDWLQISPGSNAIGMVAVTSFGFRYLEVIYTTGGVATSCNSLWCKF